MVALKRLVRGKRDGGPYCLRNLTRCTVTCVTAYAPSHLRDDYRRNQFACMKRPTVWTWPPSPIRVSFLTTVRRSRPESVKRCVREVATPREKRTEQTMVSREPLELPIDLAQQQSTMTQERQAGDLTQGSLTLTKSARSKTPPVARLRWEMTRLLPVQAQLQA